MIIEKSLSEIKAEIQYQLARLTFKGIKINLSVWNENCLKIHTTENENVNKIAGLLRQKCAEYLDKISVSICGNTYVLQL